MVSFVEQAIGSERHGSTYICFPENSADQTFVYLVKTWAECKSVLVDRLKLVLSWLTQSLTKSWEKLQEKF